MNTSEIRKFCVLGERCSGTNLLEMLIQANFYLEPTQEHHHKHFFGFSNYESSNDTLFICIVRNFYEWVCSFYDKQHHLIKTNSLLEFCTQEIHSFDENNREILSDWNYKTNEPYENIFQLRSQKIEFMLSELPNKVKHHTFVLYENIANSTFQIHFLEKLYIQFDLSKKSSIFQNIPFNAQIYMHSNNKKTFVPKKYFISDQVMQVIDQKLNKAVEKKIGYDLEIIKRKLDLNRASSLNQIDMQKKIISNRNKILLNPQLIEKMKIPVNNNNSTESTNNVNNQLKSIQNMQNYFQNSTYENTISSKYIPSTHESENFFKDEKPFNTFPKSREAKKNLIPMKKK